MEGGLAAGMIERDEGAASPGRRAGYAGTEREGVGLDSRERRQGDGPEGNDELRPDPVDCGGEMRGTGAEFAGRRAAIAARRIERQAEECVGDEHLIAEEAGLGEEGFKAATRFIAVERDTGAGRPAAAGGFADEEDGGRQRPAGWAENGTGRDDRRAAAAGAGGSEEIHGVDRSGLCGARTAWRAPARYASAVRYKGALGLLVFWGIGLAVLRQTLIPGQVCPPTDSSALLASAQSAAGWIERAQKPDGSYLYEWNAGSNVESPDYNAVRHAGVTMGLYMLASQGGDASGIPAADRAMGWMEANLIRRDDWAALRDPTDASIELGAAALMLAGLDQRHLATGDGRYDGLMHELARFIVVMQQDDGSFLLAWDPATGKPNPTERSKYATGEAFWALTLMQRIFPGEGWDGPSRKVADYLSNERDTVEHQKFPPWADQWAAYGLSEMADWPLNDNNIAYARTLAERFGFLVRVESGRTDSWWSDVLRGPRARGAGMGTWIEGLDSLWRLADADPRMRDMRDAIGERAACGAGMLAERQVTKAQAASYPRPEIGEGGWFTDKVTRMDDQQHSLSAVLRAREIVDDRKGTR